jgi:hypothetical protein
MNVSAETFLYPLLEDLLVQTYLKLLSGTVAHTLHSVGVIKVVVWSDQKDTHIRR